MLIRCKANVKGDAAVRDAKCMTPQQLQDLEAEYNGKL